MFTGNQTLTSHHTADTGFNPFALIQSNGRGLHINQIDHHFPQFNHHALHQQQQQQHHHQSLIPGLTGGFTTGGFGSAGPVSLFGSSPQHTSNLANHLNSTAVVYSTSPLLNVALRPAGESQVHQAIHSNQLYEETGQGQAVFYPLEIHTSLQRNGQNEQPKPRQNNTVLTSMLINGASNSAPSLSPNTDTQQQQQHFINDGDNNNQHRQPATSNNTPIQLALNNVSTRVGQANTTSNEQRCAICNDTSTGKHYGAYSCDGCKGFFRRTIRHNQAYECRHSRNCIIDKEHRNSCRHCRYEKCLKAGMLIGAIQHERDSIGPRYKYNRATESRPAQDYHQLAAAPPYPKVFRRDNTSSSDNKWEVEPVNKGSNEQGAIYTLMDSESQCKQMRHSVIKCTKLVSYSRKQCNVDVDEKLITADDLKGERVATVDDVGRSIHQQLRIMVEWAKTLFAFNKLEMDHKIALLKNYAAQLMIIGVAFRSIHLNDAVNLANDTVLPKQYSPYVGDFNMVVSRIIDELVLPMKQIQIVEAEYVALKAIVFFNPIRVAQSEQAAMDIEHTRKSILTDLERYVITSDKYYASECRFAKLLLLLPPLQAIAQQLVEDVQLARKFGLANVDSLMDELMLDDVKPNAQLREIQQQQQQQQQEDCSNSNTPYDSGSPFSHSSYRSVSPNTVMSSPACKYHNDTNNNNNVQFTPSSSSLSEESSFDEGKIETADASTVPMFVDNQINSNNNNNNK